MHLYSSVEEFKEYIGQLETDTDNDGVLLSMIKRASGAMESYTKRKLRGRTYGSGGLDAEYHDGEGKANLFTREYPIISVTSLYDDVAHDFGSDTLKTSSDYQIYKDMGKIQLLDDAVLGTVFMRGRSNIKLIYVAGYDNFEVLSGINDEIDFQESDGGSELNTTLTAGTYTGASLASHIKTQMEDAGAATYTISYDYVNSIFNISSDGAYLNLMWATGTNKYTNCAELLGFDATDEEDSDGTVGIDSDHPVFGMPEDLILACNMLVHHYLLLTPHMGSRFGFESKGIPIEKGGGSTRFKKGGIPEEVLSVLNPFKRAVI